MAFCFGLFGFFNLLLKYHYSDRFILNMDLTICSNIHLGLEVLARATKPFGPCWMLLYWC